MKKYFKKILALILVVVISNTFMINSYVSAQTVNYTYNINCGNASISDYQGAGIIGVDTNNLSPVNTAVKVLKGIKGNDLIEAEIQQIVDDLPNMITNSLALINQGSATMYDYSLLGITGVTSSNIVDVNDYLTGKNLTTVARVQANATVIITLIKNVNNGYATCSTYASLGITSVNADNFDLISFAIKNAKDTKGSDLVKSEIVYVVNNILSNFSTYLNAINTGQGSISDYTSLGITDVTQINLADVNDFVKGKDNSTLAKLQANVKLIVNALNNINNGSTTLTDYTTLGITKVNEDNVIAMSIAIKNAKVANGNNLTKLDIINVIDITILDLVDIKDRINNGQASLSDYTSIGIMGVTQINLVDVNDYVQGKDNSTLVKLQTNVTAIVKPLNSINNGSVTISDYTILGITTVNTENVTIISLAVKAEKVKNGSNLTKADIAKVVSDTIISINQSKIAINNGQGALADYTLIQIKGVTSLNLADVNQYVTGRDNTTLAKLQTNVSAIVTALNTISTGTATISNYTLLGITTVTTENLTPINIAAKNASTLKLSNLTKAEIVKIVADTIVDLNNSKTIINTGLGTIADYTLLGIKGVTVNNLLDVNDYVKGKDNSTIAKLQANVTTIANALNSINNGTATVVNYTTLGITTVNTDNLTPINLAVKNEIISKGSNLVRADIIKLVADTIIILNASKTNINNGAATLNDYILLGIKGVTDTNLTDVNSYVKGKDNTTLAKLQTNVTTVVNALNSINNGTAIVSNYTTIGILSVNTENLGPINLAVKDAKTLKGDNLLKVEIAKVVSDTIVNLNNAKTNINNGNGTIDDYTLVGIKGVTDINLPDVNSYVKGKDNTTVAKMQTNVTTIVTALNNINKGLGTISNYTTLGITTVNSETLTPINVAIKNALPLYGSNLTKADIAVIVQDTTNSFNSSKSSIVNGNGTLDDYTFIGIKGVTEINLDDVNSYVVGKDNTTLAKLQTNVTTVVNALNSINNGSTVMTYYTTLNITAVNTENIGPISTAIRNMKTIKGSNLTISEIVQLVNDTITDLNGARSRIDQGQGILDDFTLVGIKGVTDINLSDVNDYVKTTDNTTVAKLQANVSIVVNSLNYINNGSLVINYYTTLSILTVNSTNIKAVSLAVKEAKAIKGSNLTKSEILAIVSGIVGV